MTSSDTDTGHDPDADRRPDTGTGTGTGHDPGTGTGTDRRPDTGHDQSASADRRPDTGHDQSAGPDQGAGAAPDHGTVRAAGVLLWRPSPRGGLEVALVHRPRYDDWSWPKGKLKRGEDFAAAAVRETREETGMECELGAPLPATRYLVGGRPKEVRYWAARAGAGRFEPGTEVDEMAWLPPAAARHRLTHDRDRPLLDALLRAVEATAPAAPAAPTAPAAPAAPAARSTAPAAPPARPAAPSAPRSSKP